MNNIEIMDFDTVIDNNGVLEMVPSEGFATNEMNRTDESCRDDQIKIYTKNGSRSQSEMISKSSPILSLCNTNLSLQDHLYWPSTPIRKGKRQVEKVPFVLTSTTYKEIQEKKETEKLNLSLQKENRKKEKELQRKKKEEEKLNKKTKSRKRNPSNIENTISKNKSPSRSPLTDVNNQPDKIFKLDVSALQHARRNLSFNVGAVENERIGEDFTDQISFKEYALHQFTNKSLFQGLCFSCTLNLHQKNCGIKCSMCARTYHIKCIEKNNLHRSNSDTFTCLTCCKNITKKI